MDSNFWDQLELYKQPHFNRNNIEQSFDDNYHIILGLVDAKVFGYDFSEFVGADDGHNDLCDFIIWNGKQITEIFLLDPKTAVPLAKIMSKNKGFNGDINSLKRIIYKM